jgi:hypothetical protein
MFHHDICTCQKPNTALCPDVISHRYIVFICLTVATDVRSGMANNRQDQLLVNQNWFSYWLTQISVILWRKMENCIIKFVANFILLVPTWSVWHRTILSSCCFNQCRATKFPYVFEFFLLLVNLTTFLQLYAPLIVEADCWIFNDVVLTATDMFRHTIWANNRFLLFRRRGAN